MNGSYLVRALAYVLATAFFSNHSCAQPDDLVLPQSSPPQIGSSAAGTGSSGRLVPTVRRVVDIGPNHRVNPSKAKIRFSYSSSDPAAVTKTVKPDGTVIYAPAPGGLRIWIKNGVQYRKKVSVTRSTTG